MKKVSNNKPFVKSNLFRYKLVCGAFDFSGLFGLPNSLVLKMISIQMLSNKNDAT